jgi:hypothetical protein
MDCFRRIAGPAIGLLGATPHGRDKHSGQVLAAKRDNARRAKNILWAWRLDDEKNSAALERILGDRHPHLSFLLIIGRNSDLERRDLDRLRWRTNNVSFGQFRMVCLTYDQVFEQLKNRLQYWSEAFVSQGTLKS